MTCGKPRSYRRVTAVESAVEQTRPPQYSTAVSECGGDSTTAEHLHRSHTTHYQDERPPIDRGGPRYHRTPTAARHCLQVSAVDFPFPSLLRGSHTALTQRRVDTAQQALK
jgi:hypothetical protein